MGTTPTDPVSPPPSDPDEPLIEPAAAAPAPASPRSDAQAEALSALTNLGYAPGEAAGAVAQAADTAPQADTAAMIRAALRLLAPKG